MNTTTIRATCVGLALSAGLLAGQTRTPTTHRLEATPAAARDMTFDRCRRRRECLECTDATTASPMPHG